MLVSIANLFPSIFADTFEDYFNNIIGFGIKYPTDWEIKIDTVGSKINFNPSSPNDLKASVVITKGALDYPNMTLQDYKNQFLKYATNSSYGPLKVIDINDKNYYLGGYPAIRIEGTMDAGIIKYKMIIFRTNIDNNFYVFIAGADPANFDNYAPIFQEMLSSFSIVNNQDDINNSNGLRESFPLEVDGKNYTIETYSTNNKINIKKIDFNSDAGMDGDRLSIYIDSPTSERLHVSIPRELLDTTENGKDTPFDVSMNTFYNITSDEIKTNNQSRTLSIPITPDTNVITILGNKDKIAFESAIAKKTIDEEEEEEEQQIVTEQPKEIKQISLNLFLDTHIYTLFDQRVSVRLYNSNGQFDSQYLTVPDTGGMTYSFNIDELNVPKGTVFTVCVMNEGNNKEDCQTVNRGYGDSNINISMIIP